MVSFILPAHNEAYLIGQTLQQLQRAAQQTDQPFEIIVVDDASTDRTPAIAQSHGARVVGVNLRHIAAVRNAGARCAQGHQLIFLDADTLLPEPTLHAALAAMANAAVVGGGSRVAVDEPLGTLPRLVLEIWNGASQALGWAAGCFIFAKRHAFEAVGGFDEQYFAAEELFLSHALKRHGRFVILRQPVLTSGRKTRMYATTQLATNAIRILAGGPNALRQRKTLGLWYDAQRQTPADL